MSRDILIPGVNAPGIPQEPPQLVVAQPMNDTQIACLMAATLLSHPTATWSPEAIVTAVRAAHQIIEQAVTLEPERVQGIRRAKERVALGREGN